MTHVRGIYAKTIIQQKAGTGTQCSETAGNLQNTKAVFDVVVAHRQSDIQRLVSEKVSH